MIPLSQHTEETTGLLNIAEFDTLIVEAGSVSLESLLSSNKSLRRIIWVVRGGGKDTDWGQVPDTDSKTGKIDTFAWHDLVIKDTSSTNELPALGNDSAPSSIFTLWQRKSGTYEVIEYTHAARIHFISIMIPANLWLESYLGYRSS